MLNRNINSIIYQSYIKLGSLAYKLAINAEGGLEGTKEQKGLWHKALLIDNILDTIGDHIVVKNNSVYQLRGITVAEMNKLLSILVEGSGIFDYPVAPFIPVRDVSIVSGGGTPGGPGPAGLSAYTTIAFASDTSGTGLSAVPDISLPYVAFKTSNTPIPFITSSFVGLWVKYVGPTGPGGITFLTDILVTLANGKTLGKYLTGQTIPAIGKTPNEVIIDIANEYINPVFTSFTVSYSSTVEVGTTISGLSAFNWNIVPGSGVVPTIDLYDNTSNLTLLAGTANDGTQNQTVTTLQLNSPGATQSWKGIGHNTSPVGTFNSNNYVTTARYITFFGPSASLPSNSAQVRALPSNIYHLSPLFLTLNTGSTLTKFVVALPPGVTITSVVDIDAFDTDITSFYILTGTVSVNDAGGTPRSYNLYAMDIAVPYTSNHRHTIITS